LELYRESHLSFKFQDDTGEGKRARAPVHGPLHYSWRAHCGKRRLCIDGMTAPFIQTISTNENAVTWRGDGVKQNKTEK